MYNLCTLITFYQEKIAQLETLIRLLQAMFILEICNEYTIDIIDWLTTSYFSALVSFNDEFMVYTLHLQIVRCL